MKKKKKKEYLCLKRKSLFRLGGCLEFRGFRADGYGGC